MGAGGTCQRYKDASGELSIVTGAPCNCLNVGNREAKRKANLQCLAVLRALGLSKHVSAIAFFATHVKLRAAFGTLLVPRLLLFLPGLAGDFSGGLQLLFARFVGQLDCALWVNSVFGIRRLTTNGTRFGFLGWVSKRPWLIRHFPPRMSS